VIGRAPDGYIAGVEKGTVMIKKWIFVAGAGVGYVLGTRAGRQKYDAMVTKAREVLDRPDVQEVTQVVRAEANRLYDEGRQLVRDKVSSARAHHTDEAGVVAGQGSTTYANGAAPTSIAPN
jgi:hypothetical protein